MKHHPDNYPGASDVIKLVQHAYEVLGSHETKTIYDLFCTHILYSGKTGTSAEGDRQLLVYPKPDWVVQKNDIVYIMDMSIRNIYQGKDTTIITKDVMVDISIEQGAKDGRRIVYKGRGQCSGGAPGDLIVIINRVDYPFYLQKDNDLFCKIEIDSKVAQGGGELCIRHPSGTIVDFRLNPNEISEPSTTKMLEGMGIKSSDGKSAGNMIIQFNIYSLCTSVAS
ncbi:Type I HSP40 co-chaperone [Coemansia spiralis]|uniref:Type I HSP40 co-chaperone n=2 Tax=Coemansia TaxID=4863 RepID=A0A9W8GDD8_9FUNG|nr:Type I HSP40 co-chaperone [Coemansia umbellata]KAJ2620282.1 Type I HSP40 co-chaperone [Coemansia sp. RSA 1358]KAJ2681138.1 Type I HSP40 co-chaperone [Coemansia spiralis]